MYVCMYVCMYIHTLSLSLIYTHTYINLYIHTYIRTYICTHTQQAEDALNTRIFTLEKQLHDSQVIGVCIIHIHPLYHCVCDCIYYYIYY